MSVRIRRAGEEDAERIDAFYADMDRGATASGSLAVWIAEDGDRIVGAVRLCLEHDHLVLRTMVIREDYHGKGIGKRMLAALVDSMKLDFEQTSPLVLKLGKAERR